MICIVAKNFAKTLDLKRDFDVTKQRTPSNNDYHTPLVQGAHEPQSSNLKWAIMHKVFIVITCSVLGKLID